jgi:hypothetical protein
MQILQWSMTIPPAKQQPFEKWFTEIAGPKLNTFGAQKHELFKEENRYVERIYFANDFNTPDYFSAVKANPEAWKLSRMYEQEFGAIDIELRALTQVA